MSAPHASLILIAHNIRSLFNVGSLFRTCDGAGIQRLYLTGYTGFPPRKEITKTALGAEESVDWAHHWEIEDVLYPLKATGYEIWCVEKSQSSQDYTRPHIPEKLALILGNEVSGVEPELLEHSDKTIHVPMYGHKVSLNVSVCAGVILYGLQSRFALQSELQI